MHASHVFMCLPAAVPTLMSCLFFLLSEVCHDVIKIWHKDRNCISFFFCFGMGLLHPWFGFHGAFLPLRSSVSTGNCNGKKRRSVASSEKVRSDTKTASSNSLL